MPSIKRSGECPIYLDYITKNALIPTRELDSAFQETLKESSDYSWIDIPFYQRGISWGTETFETLLDSESCLLGNVVFGDFSISRSGNNRFQYVPVETKNDTQIYSILVDGLQRFSVGTITLSILHHLVLKKDPDNPDLAGYFQALRQRTSNCALVYLHNDRELSKHKRRAVSVSYGSFRKAMEGFIEAQLEAAPDEFAKSITSLFLKKQIAPDFYIGFSNSAELSNSFIGLNTNLI